MAIRIGTDPIGRGLEGARGRTGFEKGNPLAYAKQGVTHLRAALKEAGMQ